jgi:hypothetical protein
LFFGMVAHHGAHRGVFVTTSTFTSPARDLAEQRDIELVDGPTLVRQVAEAGLALLAAERAQPGIPKATGRRYCNHCGFLLFAWQARCPACLTEIPGRHASPLPRWKRWLQT